MQAASSHLQPAHSAARSPDFPCTAAAGYDPPESAARTSLPYPAAVASAQHTTSRSTPAPTQPQSISPAPTAGLPSPPLRNRSQPYHCWPRATGTAAYRSPSAGGSAPPTAGPVRRTPGPAACAARWPSHAQSSALRCRSPASAGRPQCRSPAPSTRRPSLPETLRRCIAEIPENAWRYGMRDCSGHVPVRL